MVDIWILAMFAALSTPATDVLDDLPDIAPDPRPMPPGRAVMARLISMREQAIRHFGGGVALVQEIRPERDRCPSMGAGLRYGWHTPGFGRVPQLLIMIPDAAVVWMPQRILISADGGLLLELGRGSPVQIASIPLPIQGVLRREPVLDVLLAQGLAGVVLRRRIWLEDCARG